MLGKAVVDAEGWDERGDTVNELMTTCWDLLCPGARQWTVVTMQHRLQKFWVQAALSEAREFFVPVGRQVGLVHGRWGRREVPDARDDDGVEADELGWFSGSGLGTPPSNWRWTVSFQ